MRKTRGTAAGLLETEAAGDGDGVDFGSRDVLGIDSRAAVAEQVIGAAKVVASGDALLAAPAAYARSEQDAAAGLDGTADGSGLDDFSGGVAAEDVRHVEGQSWKASADMKVKVVECAGLDLDENFVGPDLRFWGVFVGEDFGSAVFADSYGFHGDLTFVWVSGF